MLPLQMEELRLREINFPKVFQLMRDLSGT